MIKINNTNLNIMPYDTARIDIKNRGKLNNKIEILDNSDNNSLIHFPKWFKQDDGEGLVVQSSAGKLDLKIKCINDGKLNLRLRGIDARNNDNDKLPIFINFVNVCINDNQILNENKLVSHEDFYQCNEIDVKNDDVIMIHIEWTPFKLDYIDDSLIFKQLNPELNPSEDNQVIGESSNHLKIFEENKFPPKVSVIIPIFNPGELLYKCLDSVVNQSLNDIEIICVDDGSTDNSREILKNYGNRDSRFKIFHQENKGAGAARNKAIKESCGEYIIFLDSDDWIEEDMCRNLYAHAQKLNSDLVFFDSLWHTIDGIKEFNYFSKNEFLEDYQKFTFDYHFILNRLLIASYGVIWSRFYKSSFIKKNNIEFPKHKIYNDVEFCFKTALLAKNIAYYPKPFYHYIKLGQPSLQTSFREGKDELIWFDVLEGLRDIFIQHGFMEELRLDFINYCIFYSFEKLKNIGNSLQKPFLVKFKSFFEKLDPSFSELNLLKSLNLTWYTSNTLNYLPLYNDVMSNKFDLVLLKIFEIKLIESKESLDNAPLNSKESIYQTLRNNLLSSKVSLEILKKLPVELSKFYESTIYFEEYSDYALSNNLLVTRTNVFDEILWDDLNNAKSASEYTIYKGQPGKFEVIGDYKQLNVPIKEPTVVRVFSQIFTGDIDLDFEIKVSDYANIGLSNSNDVLKFAFVRISNKDWLHYRFTRINGLVNVYRSYDGVNWEKFNLTGNRLSDDEVQFQFNCGYSNANNKKIMIRNLRVYKI